jgi:molybdopterin-guanine dinucleotide biosynthesis protein A
LCALRCATCAPVVERRIAAGQRKASRLLTDGELRVCWIEEPALRAIDPQLRALFNVNAPEDIPSR